MKTYKHRVTGELRFFELPLGERPNIADDWESYDAEVVIKTANGTTIVVGSDSGQTTFIDLEGPPAKKALTFAEYAAKAAETAVYPLTDLVVETNHAPRGTSANYLYPVLALAEEAGEVAGKVAKRIRDNYGEVDDDFREAIKKELGDVLWQLTAVTAEFGWELEEVAQANLDKLADRATRGTLKGSGDDR